MSIEKIGKFCYAIKISVYGPRKYSSLLDESLLADSCSFFCHVLIWKEILKKYFLIANNRNSL